LRQKYVSLIKNITLFFTNLYFDNREPRILTVILGDHNQHIDGDDDEIYARIESIHSHAKFNPENRDNDIALLKLVQSIKYKKNVLPACLPSNGTKINHNSKLIHIGV